MQWQVRWPGVVAQVRPEPVIARERLRIGQNHLAEAEELLERGLPDLALLLAETALVNGADATLLLHGFAVNNHAARFSYPLLPYPYQSTSAHRGRAREARAEGGSRPIGLTPVAVASKHFLMAVSRPNAGSV
jgi:hypothetical protein